mmetsp:Transcript_7033/g.11560  ORF Transcript_7033/g.11560 Transcript_7033/m.11560 type:complete len:82 (-) Transcript_7033:589-834(-)
MHHWGERISQSNAQQKFQLWGTPFWHGCKPTQTRSKQTCALNNTAANKHASAARTKSAAASWHKMAGFNQQPTLLPSRPCL